MGDFAAGFASGAGQVLPGAIQDKERRAQQKQQFTDELKLRQTALDQEAARNAAYIALLNAQAAAMTQGTAAGAFETDPAVIEAKRNAAIAAGKKATAEGDTAAARLDAELAALRAQTRATTSGVDIANRRLLMDKNQFDRTFSAQQKRWEADQEAIAEDREFKKRLAGWDYEFKLQESAQRGVLANIQKEAAERAKNELGPTGNAFLGYQLQYYQAQGIQVQPDQFQQLVNAARQFDTPNGTGRPTGKIDFGSGIPGIGGPEIAAVQELSGNMPIKQAIPAIANDPEQAQLFWGRTKKLLMPYGNNFVTISVDAANYGDARATIDKAIADIPKEMRTPEQIQRAVYEYQSRYNLRKQAPPNTLDRLSRSMGPGGF